MKRGCLLLVLTVFLLSSCGARPREPEQIALVSAVGFDGVGDRIRLTVELPTLGEDAAGTAKLLTGEGNSASAALVRLTDGAPKELVFSHCALMVLGEDLTRGQLEDVFAFAGQGTHIPQEAQAVCASNAYGLLSSNENAATALGYEIPAVLEQVSRGMGVELHCAVYRLYATADPDGAVVLPYFGVAEESSGQAAAFEGLRILRAGGSAIAVDAEEAALLAWLSERGTDRRLTLSNGLEVKEAAAALSAAKREGRWTLSCHLTAALPRSLSEEDRRALEGELGRCAEALLVRLTEMGLPLIGERLAREAPDVWAAFSREGLAAEIHVICTLKGEDT